jgi:hypothetical protein
LLVSGRSRSRRTSELGVGRILMQAVIDRARERGFPGVRLLLADCHSRSLSLYTKLGFEVREPMSLMQSAPLRQTMEGCTVRKLQKATSKRLIGSASGCTVTAGRANCVMASVRVQGLSWSGIAG